MDAVTAVSGCGPAYVFLLPNVSPKRDATRASMRSLRALGARYRLGAGALLSQSDLGAAKLSQNVTSPGGTTAAALEVLMGKGGFKELLIRAVAAAAKRSRELSS